MIKSLLYLVYMFGINNQNLIHSKYFFPSWGGAMLNAPQRRFSLAVWSNLNTSASYIPLCAHRFYIPGLPQCLLRVPEHWGPISISRLPICLLRVPQHWVPFSIFISRLPICPLRVPQHWVPFSISRLPFGLLRSPSASDAFSKFYKTQYIFWKH